MADAKISALSAASSVADADIFPLVQGGSTKKATRDLLLGGLGTATQVTWNSDSGLKRVVAGLLAPSNGAAGVGGIQNTAGRARMTTSPTNITNVMSNLTDLSLTLVTGRKYTGMLVLFANNSTAGEGLQFDFNGGGASMTSFEAGFAATPPGAGLALGVLTTTALATALTATTATTADAVYMIPFGMVCASGGTFIPRFAENSAHTSGTATVKLGSYLWIEDSPN